MPPIPIKILGLSPLIHQFLALTRWKEWATSKMPFLISCLLISQMQAGSKTGQVNPLDMLLLFLQLCLLAAYGYMVNSFCDIASDNAAGKTNAFSELNPPVAKALMLSWLGLASALGLAQFATNRAGLGLLAACYGSATAYSTPPLRLKERGWIGLIAASAAQRLLPVILIFVTLGIWTPTAWLLCLLNGQIGLRYIVAHQIDDYQNDLRSGTQTMATSKGPIGMIRLGRFILLPLETLTLLSTLLLLRQEIPAMSWFIPAYLSVFIIYILWLPSQRLRVVDGASYAPFSGLYNIFMPLYLAIILALSHYGDSMTSIIMPLLIMIWLLPEIQEKILNCKGMASSR